MNVYVDRIAVCSIRSTYSK